MKKVSIILSSILLMGFVACSDDDSDDATPTSTPNTSNTTPRVMVMDQTTNRNTITVSEIYMPENGFAVVHRDNGSDTPVTPGIISDTVVLNSGLNSNVVITLNDAITNGEKLWVMTHIDADDDGIYNFPSAPTGKTVDGPLSVDNDILMTSLNITAPSITVNDSTAVMNNQMTIPSVNAAVDGWLIIHYASTDPNLVIAGTDIQLEPIAGKVKVTAGVNNDVVVDLVADSTYNIGRKLYPMLHVNANNDDVYDFPGGVDVPEIFSNNAFPGNVVVVSTLVK